MTFDQHLCFNVHFQKIRSRALSRLDIIKIFSNKSWHLSKRTLVNIYRALIGSVFDYFFFTFECISETSVGLVQRIQNRAVRCIYKLRWDSPSGDLARISGVDKNQRKIFCFQYNFRVFKIKNNNYCKRSPDEHIIVLFSNDNYHRKSFHFDHIECLSVFFLMIDNKRKKSKICLNRRFITLVFKFLLLKFFKKTYRN